MGVLSICKKSRYPLNPTDLCYTFLSPHSKTLPCSTPTPPFSAIHLSNPTCSVISPTGHPSLSQIICSLASKSCLSGTLSYRSNSSNSCSNNLCCFLFRSFSSYSNTRSNDEDRKLFRFDAPSGEISRIIDIIKGDGSDMETSLDSIGSNLSKWSVIDILRGLNVAKVPALRFFEWVRDVHPNHHRNADICSLMVDNCGRLGDYTTMLALLKDFQSSKICLTDNAFGFLPLLSTTKEAAEKSIRGVITVLNEVGGSCRNSGIHSLVELLCSLSSFDLARFVMEITEKKASYYSVLVKHICVKRQFEEARHVLEEMWESRCDPHAKAYNYLISSLCKHGRIDEGFSVLEEMLDKGCPPDGVTFEILIYFACRYGRSEDAVKFYNQMVSIGIRARLPTRYAFVRGYFNSRQFEKAYKYVVDTSVEDKWSGQEIYNVLAGLHLKHGDLLVAHNLLVEMMEKGLRPNDSLFVRVSKRLNKTGKERFAENLSARFSSLMEKFRPSAG